MASNWSHLTRFYTPSLMTATMSASTIRASTTINPVAMSAGSAKIGSGSFATAVNLRLGAVKFSDTVSSYAYTGIAANDVLLGNAYYYNATAFGTVDLLSIMAAAKLYVSIPTTASNSMVVFSWIDISA